MEPKEACAESDVLIRISNFNPDNSYTWFLGDGTEVSGIPVDSLFHTYKEPGCYDIDVASVTPFGCYARSKEVCAVKILAQPLASFKTDPDQPGNTDEILNLYDRSIGANQVIWFVGEDTIYNRDVLEYHFEEWALPMTVRQVVISADGCTDTLNKQMIYQYETLVYYPSAFTPNSDGLNDEFTIVGEAISDIDFHLVIYDRWGNIVFESKKQSNAWDGRLKNGSMAPHGMYPLKLSYRDHLGELRTIDDKVFISNAGKPTPLR
ncbi:MAG: gliding motility-associated C-terminal domain-containing protein [Cryomorphaceae bacterium]